MEAVSGLSREKDILRVAVRSAMRAASRLNGKEHTMSMVLLHVYDNKRNEADDDVRGFNVRS